MEKFATESWEVIASGGLVMVGLAVLSLLLYGTAFKLILFAFRGNLVSASEDKRRRWLENPAHASGRLGEVIKYLQPLDAHSQSDIRSRFEEIRQAYLNVLDRRLVFLGTLVGGAPLLGLLGTVVGMLATFEGIAAGGGAETTELVAEGISQALITTQTGLLIALPGLFVMFIIRRRKYAIFAVLAHLESLAMRQRELRAKAA